MREKIKHVLHRLHPVRITESLRLFIRDETIGGKLVIAAAALSLIVVNSPLQDVFMSFWHQKLSIGIGNLHLEMSFVHWVNEALMAFFFLVVGLEIKREFTRGEMRDRKTATLPIGAAFGGMLIPALFYLAFAGGTPAAHGWGIAVATDTAIAVAVLALLGHRVPLQLKVFLLAMAVADDVFAIGVIGIFYTENADLLYLACSFAIIGLIYLFRRYLSSRLLLVVGLGIVLWITTHQAGVHASIVGVVMGLLAPIPRADSQLSTPEKVERFFLPITTLFVVPLFAFANAGFVISADPFLNDQYVVLAIVAGLVVGKVTGITLICWLLVKLGLAKLPSDLRWAHIIGAGFIAGIGFTVSIFIAELAFDNGSPYIVAGKTGIFIASTVSALIGLAFLRRVHRRYG